MKNLMNNNELKFLEERFHDSWAASIHPANVLVEESWMAATCPEHNWIRMKLGELKGKRILDLGCGAGEAAVWFAKQGADVVACDISAGFLELVRKVAAFHSVEVQVHKADAENYDLEPESFDVVYAGNLLHHVEIAQTLDRIWLVLKFGGKLVSWDPLIHNPVINLYRKMAQAVRTEGEHPLAIRDLKLFRERFRTVEYDSFWFLTLWIFVRFFLIERVHPGKERYWKKIIVEHERLEPIFRRLNRLDTILKKYFPFIKRYCWNIAVCATK
jgi:SAM-dependent methyltransferase